MSNGFRSAVSPTITRPTVIAATQPISVADVGKWLKLSAGQITLNTDVITALIATTTEVFEKYIWLDLRRKTYEADFELGSNIFFPFVEGTLSLALQRAPILALTDISKIEYLDENGVYVEFAKGATTADGLFENVTEKFEQRQWASVYFREAVPFDFSRINAYKIRVTFEAGFTPGTPANLITDVPAALKTAMLMTIAAYYTNRGDCSDCGCDLDGYPVPCGAKGIADMYSIAKTVLGGSYQPGDRSGFGGGLC